MRYLLILLPLLLVACASGPRDTRPELLRQADGYLGQAHSAYASGDYAQATQRYRQALLAYRSIDHPEGEVLSRFGLANLALALHNSEALSEQIDRVSQRLELNALPQLQPRLSLLRAEQAAAAGDRAGALARLDDIGGQQAEQADLAWSAQVLRCRLSSDAALAACVERLRPLLQAERPRDAARLARFEAQLATLRGDAPASAEHYQQALDHYRSIADRPGIAATLGEWGSHALAQGELQVAEDRLRRALFIRIWLLQREQSAELLDQLGQLYRQRDDAAATEWAERWREHLLGDGEKADWSGLSSGLDRL